MRPISIVTLVLLTLSGVGVSYWLGAGETRRHWPKATPPPPPSPVYTQSRERAPDEEEIQRQAREHNARLESELELALLAKDAQRREAAFTFILPELVQVEPSRAVAMVARLEPGEARDTLRAELARQWIAKDADAAVRWMKTLPDAERRASAVTAIESILAHSPDEAAALADEFGIDSPLLPRLKASRN